MRTSPPHTPRMWARCEQLRDPIDWHTAKVRDCHSTPHSDSLQSDCRVCVGHQLGTSVARENPNIVIPHHDNARVDAHVALKTRNKKSNRLALTIRPPRMLGNLIRHALRRVDSAITPCVRVVGPSEHAHLILQSSSTRPITCAHPRPPTPAGGQSVGALEIVNVVVVPRDVGAH